jgi:ATP-dependent Zn protease
LRNSDGSPSSVACLIACGRRQGESDQRRRERAAYHEAAHAVLAHTADMPIIKVEITPTGNKRTGGCLFTRVDHAELCQRHGAVTTLAMLYSGAVSNRRRFGDNRS